jgi:toxin FitB
MTFLLDTNVISEIRKPHPDRHVVAWWDTVTSAEVFISALTIGEIRLGIERLRRKDNAQADLLERWLHGLRAIYEDHIINVDAGIAEEWGHLSVPDPLPTIDGLLAATARARGLILVTHNVADLARSGIRVLNPFDPADHNK